jgi:hypothetical protein
LQLTNVLGQIITATTINSNQQYDMNLNELANGMYFLTVTTNEKSETQKIYLAK